MGTASSVQNYFNKICMFCPPRPATATSLPLLKTVYNKSDVFAASSTSAYKSPLWVRNYSSYILHLPTFLPKTYGRLTLETVPLFQKTKPPSTACVPAFSARHNTNTKTRSKTPQSTKNPENPATCVSALVLALL